MTDSVGKQNNSEKNVQSNNHEKKKKIIGFTMISIVVIASAIFLLNWWIFNLTHAETDNAQIDGHTYYISSKIPGTVSTVLVEDFQYVEKGDVLFKIDPADYELSVARAETALGIVKSNIRVVDKEIITSSLNANTTVDLSNNEAYSSKIKINEINKTLDVLNANLKANKAVLEEARKNYERYTFLNENQSITDQELDKIKACYDIAKANYDATMAQITKVKDSIDIAKSNYQSAMSNVAKARTLHSVVEVNKSRKLASQASLQQAKVRLQEAKQKLSYTVVYAPVSGVIGRKTVEGGQVIQPTQPLMVIVPQDKLWVTANYKETHMEKIKMGQHVEIKIDSYPSKSFTGKVKSLSPATGARFSLIPPDNASGNFTKVVQKVPVKIVFDEIQDKDLYLAPGMNVVATINTSGK